MVWKTTVVSTSIIIPCGENDVLILKNQAVTAIFFQKVQLEFCLTTGQCSFSLYSKVRPILPLLALESCL